ncbi:thiamine pyrophosphate-dependent enzyme [Telmatobacter sp. DSM 110680]|uniref:Thiamine pyrophosphate-dependent enzyme n=1 Tax=Telmatobacter sp. DSM 110680 TaxID=3036704 RepID=A0AAU7DH42_9BACT
MAKTPNAKTEHKAKPVAAEKSFSLVSNEKLLAIYTAMVKCRMLEQRATLLFQQGKLDSDLHASAGREAASAGIAIDLQPNDTLGILPGEWLPAFVKGVTLDNLFRTLAPTAAERSGQQALAAGDLGLKNILTGDEAQVPETVRERAVEAQAAQEGAIVVAILPSTAKSLKPWQTVMTAAAAQKLPIVFAHYVGIESEGSNSAPKDKSKNPEALVNGLPAIVVDADDAVAVYRVAYEAIIRARQGRGATLLRCVGRSAVSTAAKPESGGKSGIHAISNDPVSSMEIYLESKGIEPKGHNREVVTSFNRDLELATRFLDQ